MKAHFRLLSVYPWTKNSGKVARLLMNFILIKHGYLPAVIHSIERQRYYEVLRFENDGLMNLVVESLENSIETTAKFLDEINGLRVKRASWIKLRQPIRPPSPNTGERRVALPPVASGRRGGPKRAQRATSPDQKGTRRGDSSPPARSGPLGDWSGAACRGAPPSSEIRREPRRSFWSASV